MILRAPLLALICLAMPFTCLHAQTATGTLVPRRATSVMAYSQGRPLTDGRKVEIVAQSPEALATARAMFACVIRREPEATRTFLLTDDEAAKSDKLARAMSPCLSNVGPDDIALTSVDLNFSKPLESALMAEAYLKGHPVASPAAISVDQLQLQPYWAKPMGALERVALCLTAKRPSDVVALLLTPINSVAERNVVDALSPNIPSCVDNGSTISIKREMLRVFLARALFRRAYEENAGVQLASERK